MTIPPTFPIMPLDDALLVLGTSVTLASFMGVAGLWVVRSVMRDGIGSLLRDDIEPLKNSMSSLNASMEGLTATLTQQRLDAKESRSELHDAITGIHEMLAAHQNQLGQHETRITVLEQPARSTSKIRSSR